MLLVVRVDVISYLQFPRTNIELFSLQNGTIQIARVEFNKHRFFIPV